MESAISSVIVSRLTLTIDSIDNVIYVLADSPCTVISEAGLLKPLYIMKEENSNKSVELICFMSGCILHYIIAFLSVDWSN